MTQHALILWSRPALAGMGLALSLWMLRRSSGTRGLPGCGAGSGCDAVTHSRWSRWLGMPVAAPASLVYLLMLTALGILSVAPPGRAAAAARMVLGSAGPLVAFAAIWFVALQGLAVRRFCLYCMLLHAIGLGVAALVVFGPNLGVRPGAAGWAAAGAGAAALVLGQALVEPRMYRVVVSGQSSETVVSGQLSVVSGEDRTPARPGNIRGSAALRPRLDGTQNGGPHSPSCGIAPLRNTQGSNPFASKQVVAMGGKVSLEGGKWPVLGSPLAECVLVYLMDYTCENCRLLHGVLLEAMRESAEAFAVMMVPVPRDPRCNRAIARPEPEHANACAYARLALAVWAADWRRYAAFDAFLFESGEPPALGLARRRAEALLGRELFDPTVADPDIDPVIREGIELYESVGAERTPTVLMPAGFFTGRVTTTKELWGILEKGGVGGTKSTSAVAPIGARGIPSVR